MKKALKILPNFIKIRVKNVSEKQYIFFVEFYRFLVILGLSWASEKSPKGSLKRDENASEFFGGSGGRFWVDFS